MSHPLCRVCVVQLSSTQVGLSDVKSVVDSYLSSLDVGAMSGSEVVDFVSSLAPVVRSLQFALVEAGVRGVAVDQHNVSGARSGAAWFSSLMGISEWSGQQQLGSVRSMSAN